MTPAAASSPYAEPPVSITPSTRPDWCVGSSVSISRVPVARPKTHTPPRSAPSTPLKTVSPVAPRSSDACPTARPTPEKSALTPSPFRALSWLFRLTIATASHAAHVAHHADERAAIHARVALGRALLVAARPADHRVAFLKLRHSRKSRLELPA